jgi:hypothetical protein
LAVQAVSPVSLAVRPLGKGRYEANSVNRNQIIVAVAGMVVEFGIYYIIIIVPIAKVKREHPEIFASNPPNAVVGGSLLGIIALFVVLAVTVVAIILLRNKG